MIRICAVVSGGALGGLALFAAAAYVSLWWFDLPTLIEEF